MTHNDKNSLFFGFAWFALFLFGIAACQRPSVDQSQVDPKSEPTAREHPSSIKDEGRTTSDGFLMVSSLSALREHLSGHGVKVRLAPGTYRLDSASSPQLLDITGNGSHFDFTGAKIEVDTVLLQGFKEGTDMVRLSGDNLIVEGLAIETVGEGVALAGTRAVSITGKNNILKNVALQVGGSSPYGYGSFFGIGKGASIKLSKVNGIRVGGDNAQVLNCRIVMRGLGHGIFVRGAHNTLIKDCHVEGALRKTDEILAETSGPAFDRSFRQYTGQPIPAGEMTSLSEDGIRAYDMDEKQRRTTSITVENCTVKRMRRGICLAFAVGPNRIENCTVTECERAGYNLGSNTVVRGCRGDALFTQVLDIHSGSSREVDAQIDVLNSRDHYGNSLLAKINGSGHRVSLRPLQASNVPADMVIEVASDRGFGEGRKSNLKTANVFLLNETLASVKLNQEAKSCEIESLGPVVDHGFENVVENIK